MTRSRTRSAVRVAIGAVLCGALLFPLYWMVAVSLTRPQDLIRSPPALFPTDPTFDGYALAIDRNLSSMGTSLLIALGTVVITLVIALPAAYGMSKLRAPGTGAVMFAFLLAQMIPSVVVVTALFALYKQLGLLDSYPGLMLANATASVPFAIILLQAFMRTIPDELLEAARIDGAGRLRTFGSIVVPLSRNAVVTAALFAFLFSWGDFLNAKTLTTGNSITPMTLALFRFVGAEATNWNGVMATAVLASVPAAVLLVVAQRYVAAGVTAGAVKD
ncbi:carbohydrate ABC transporter permease [Cellulomonas sp. C5510]|uniref:carbohydrate ABC transporter permease n=1 Tax=Cellulomonas sp. C5510 TaxID=2871170 RepID=UPI001C95516D|nr:carbohydrate ABC transporter permease [Cellulomonas sp. C5510]QZN86208.1 carbohydrate ABC transporter permease [Cellulomonas sp. C5510]